MIRRFLLFLAGLSLVTAHLLLPTEVRAATATLSVSPSSVSTGIGKTFTVSILANAGEPMNAAAGTVTYTSSLLDISSISQSGSIFTLWTTNPTAGSTVKFGGGLSNPGFVGNGGKLFSITFKAKAAGTATIGITGGEVRANDGLGTNIYSGSGSATVTIAETLNGLSIASKTHPNEGKWYSVTTAELNWNQPSDVSSFNYSLSGSETKSGSLSTTTISFPGLTDGTWTFSLTGKSSKGDRSASFTLHIDTISPGKPTIEVKQQSPTDPFPVFNYSATDEPSGIDHYEITVDNGSAVLTSETSLKAKERVRPGDHTVKVKAVDKAGNTSENTASFSVEGFPGPVITYITKFVSVLQPVVIKGTALSQAKILLFVDGKQEAEFVVKENLTDAQRSETDVSTIKDDQSVEWVYTYRATLLPGKHSFYAIQVKPDTSESNPSNTVQTQVLWSSIVIGSLTLPLFLIVLILLLLVIILLILLLWAGRRGHGAVKGWRGRLLKLKGQVDKDLHGLEHGVVSAAEDNIKKPKVMREKITKKFHTGTEAVDKTLDSVISIAEEDENKK